MGTVKVAEKLSKFCAPATLIKGRRVRIAEAFRGHA
jgi:hypothetical protein